MDFNKLVGDYREDIIKTTQEIVRIKSVEEAPAGERAPFGQGPKEALDYMIELGEEMGFEVEDFDGYAAHMDYGQGEEVLGILGHVDVVPEGGGWTHPPYAAEIHDDKIYGRGTMDDKGPVIAALYGMKILKDQGIDLDKKVRLILGTNEESGWGCMKHYFKVQAAPDMGFTPDANFPVIYGEKGIINFNLEQDIDKKSKDIELISLKAGNAPNMVPESAEIVVGLSEPENLQEKIKDIIEDKFNYDVELTEKGLKLTTYGISAHGSTPEVGINAISHLMLVLEKIFEVDTSIYKFAKIYNERIAYSHNGEKIGCGLSDDISGKLNFNPGVLYIEDGKIKLTVNVRYPIKSSAREVYNGISENLEGEELYLLEGETDQKPLYTPKDNFLVEKLMKVYREETGDIDSEPITIGGGTYARAMDNAVAFGPVFPGQEELAHQKDEFISIDHLMKLTSIYTRAIYELCK